jgi:4-amino-4-deoxychorismate lyase
MSLLVETIKVQNGNFQNIIFHNERINRSLYAIYGLKRNSDLAKIIEVPVFARKGVFKCRVIYDDKTIKVEFLKYIFRSIMSLKVIVNENICYPYKYIARDKINRLMEMRGDFDDILIIKNGMVTDSSCANVIFREPDGHWVTPASYLLPGTRRASLLQSGQINETIIGYNDINKYTAVKLINAMLDISDTEEIPIRNII